MFKLFKARWILIGCQLLKNYSEIDSNDIVPLCDYCYRCGMDFCILFELELLL